jgi:putative nucleotidyltransferase with HDIG domain
MERYFAGSALPNTLSQGRSLRLGLPHCAPVYLGPGSQLLRPTPGVSAHRRRAMNKMQARSRHPCNCVETALAIMAAVVAYSGLESEQSRMSELDDLARRAQELEIENRRLKTALSDLERSYDITLEALGDALDLKEGSKGNHSKRVCAFSMCIARAMGLPPDQVAVIARGAFLHDIGKMAIPDQILVKPGPLDAHETAIMREHCFKGYQVINKIPFLAEPSEIVYAHHEHYDGTGYPRGLKGKQIPLGARIVAVANTLDSITSDLTYRAARSLMAAREEIRAWSGRQFDPEIVVVFQQMPDAIFEELRRAISAQVQPQRER